MELSGRRSGEKHRLKHLSPGPEAEGRMGRHGCDERNLLGEEAPLACNSAHHRLQT